MLATACKKTQKMRDPENKPQLQPSLVRQSMPVQNKHGPRKDDVQETRIETKIQTRTEHKPNHTKPNKNNDRQSKPFRDTRSRLISSLPFKNTTSKKASNGYPKMPEHYPVRSHAPQKRSKRTTDQKASNSDRILTKHCQTTDVQTQTWTEEANGSET
ncbi:hypothetical protein HYFRA_00011695 [Hymenoscyphus fraxineus]|uniref:Uncharacterized protein n=1 Tax=Hymenoscyphus fraxineus TaxID=746836 RepID=A0A9N9KXN3_9HELO|nr:hypothetical protein HYFRA_00011695 [Hymenoscyphus fraxineus]